MRDERELFSRGLSEIESARIVALVFRVDSHPSAKRKPYIFPLFNPYRI